MLNVFDFPNFGKFKLVGTALDEGILNPGDLDEVTATPVACIQENCDRDHNAAINTLKLALSTVGHTGTNASGDLASIWLGENLSQQAGSVKEESPRL